VDYNATVYLNGQLLGSHAGGYDGFSFMLPALAATNNELIVSVYDPSDSGVQVEGKQRVSAITHPGGDTYTPSSGIWQTVWVEAVPAALRIAGLKVRGDMTSVHITVGAFPEGAPGLVTVAVSLAGAQVATASGAGATIRVAEIDCQGFSNAGASSQGAPKPPSAWPPTLYTTSSNGASLKSPK
jgi:hypothetical protein